MVKKKEVKSEQQQAKPEIPTVAAVGKPSDLMQRAIDVARVVKETISKVLSHIADKDYVRVEGWELIAALHGCHSGAGETEREYDNAGNLVGYSAKGYIRNNRGEIIGTAEGFVGMDELWKDRKEYAARAMAQTRAISRACRSMFAHIITLIDENISTVPAEEVPEGGLDEQTIPGTTGHRRTKPYEEETKDGDKKVAEDVTELATFLKKNEIPDGFLLRLLQDKKLIDGHTKTVAGIKPGILRRCLSDSSKTNLLKAWTIQKADEESGGQTPPQQRAPEPHPFDRGTNGDTKTEVRTKEGDQRNNKVRQPATNVNPHDVLTQFDIDNWRKVKIHFGKKSAGKTLGSLESKSLTWWIENYEPKPYKGKWQEKDLLLDAALCLASAELSGGPEL